MAEGEKKNYIRSFIKERETKFGKVINASLNMEDLGKLPVDKYGSVKLVIAPRKEVGDYGQTHSCFEDTFVPQKQEGTEDEVL